MATTPSSAKPAPAKEKEEKWVPWGPLFVRKEGDKHRPFLKGTTEWKINATLLETIFAFAAFAAIGFGLIKAFGQNVHLSRLGYTLRTFTGAMFVVFAIFGVFRDQILPRFKGKFASDLRKALYTGPIDVPAIDFPWSLVHHLAGWMLFYMGAPILLVMGLTIAWEFFEMFAYGLGPTETNQNRLSDIFLAWAGFVLAAGLNWVGFHL